MIADLEITLDEPHRALDQRLADVRAELAAASAIQDDAARARAVAAELGRLGLYAHLVPAGEGDAARVDVRALCLIRACLGHVSPLADAIFAVHGLGSYPVALAGQGEGARALLDRCRAGATIGGFALTEPEAGSDVASMRATAEHQGGARYRLSGHKIFISNVGIASHYVVFASVDPGAGRKGITGFLVRAGAPGLTERPMELSIDHPIGELLMDGCEAELLGEVGGGFKLALRTLDAFRVTVGAAAVGMAQRALDEALAHVRGRVQFGRALAEQPVVQSYLADMATELDAARLLVLRAACAHDRAAAADRDTRQRLSTQAAMAKLYATEAAQRIVDRAVQLLGGQGVTRGNVVESLYRAIRPLRIYEGTSEIQRLIIGRALSTA